MSINAKSFLNIEDVDKFEKYLKDPEAFIEEFCYITTKKGEFTKLKLNYPQKKLMNIIKRNLEDRKPTRIRVLKARQMGFSTLISALGFWWAAMNENSTYAVVAHKDDSASSIFEKNKIFYDNLPEALKPATDRFNSERISFNRPGGSPKKGLRSKIFFGTAGGGELFRGETILFLHKSEVAFWEDKDGMLKKSLNATVPDGAFTAIIEETTPNGYNQFKDDWDRSVKGKDSYTPLFVGWQEMPDYHLEPPSDFVPTQKELEIQMDHDLTDSQLYWRRVKIANDYSGNELWFQQEYPLTPEEAFIASGMGVFSGETIKEGYRYSEKPKYAKQIESVMIRDKLMIWEKPEKKEQVEYQKRARWSDEKQDYEYYESNLEIGRKTVYANYTIGLDTSGMGADRNQLVVWHNIHKRMVARIGIENISEKNLAKVAVEVARYYNNAMIAPEVNYSHAICDYIMDMGYENVYLTENMSRADRKKESVEYGWKTTTLTKPPIISGLRALLDERPSAIPDEEFWFESEYYILEDPAKNIMNAASGHHDDIIMACAIANYVSNSFQSIQTYSQLREMYEEPEPEYEGVGLVGLGKNSKKKSKKLKRGVFTNHA